MISSNKSGVYAAAFLTVCFFGVWIVFNYPAFSTLWWTRNDTEFLDLQKIGLISQMLLWLSRGLPLGFVFWIVPYRILSWLDPMQASILMRIIQGLLHCFSAAIMAILIQKVHRRSFSWLAVLAFLLWPFGGAATYWLAAMTYPMAAMVSLLGLTLLVWNDDPSRKNKAMAFCLIVSAILISRDASMACAIVFLCLLGIDLIEGNEARWHKHWRLILLAYVCGGILTFGIAAGTSTALGFPEEATTPILSGITILFWIIRTFITWPDFYPQSLALLHLCLLSLSIISAVHSLCANVQLKHRFRRLLMVTGIFLLLLLLPFVPQSFTGIFNFPWRRMYLSPLIFVFAYCLLLLARIPLKISAFIFLFLLGVNVTFFYFLSYANAEEHVRTYTEDIRVLRDLEKRAFRNNVSTVIVANLPERNPQKNPYHLRYYFGESKISAFQIFWTSDPFIRVFSKTLHPSEDPTARKRCLQFCESQRSIDYEIIDELHSLCYCP